LENKAYRGLLLLSLRQGVFQFLLLLKILIVANILGPDIFGLFGVLFLCIILLEQLSQTGINFALIHMKTNHREYYDTAWTIQLIRGFLLFVLLILLRNFFEEIFGLSDTQYLFAIIGLTLILEGLVNIGSIEFMKELDYNKEFIFRILPDLANILIAILFTFILLNVWALIIGLIAERVVRLLLSYKLCNYRPKLSINYSQLKFLFNYGKWIFFMGLLGFTLINGADLIVGITLGVVFVAFYQLANKLGTFPTLMVVNLLNNVSIPTFAKLQEDFNSLLETFKAIIFIQTLFFSLYFSIVYRFSFELVYFILGIEWLVLVEPLQILLLVGFIQGLSQSVEPVFIALGKQKNLVKWQILGVMILVSLSQVVVNAYGLIGIAWTLAVVFSVVSLGYLLEIYRFLFFNSLKMIIPIIKILLVGGLNYLFLQLFQIPTFIEVVLYSIVGIFSFGVFVFLIHIIMKIELIEYFKKIIDETSIQHD
jgi:O-antigen/teichoic acid export membrane protein